MNKMNKKGEGIGVFIIIFIGIIVSLALFSGTFESIGNTRNIYTITNAPITTAAVNQSVTLTGRENTTAVTVVNGTDGTDWSVNFTVLDRNVGGSLAILLKTTQDAEDAGQSLQDANVTYSYKPYGYNDSSGARSIMGIILVFGALAIAIFVVPGFKDLMNN